jgi:hypothetical protein
MRNPVNNGHGLNNAGGEGGGNNDGTTTPTKVIMDSPRDSAKTALRNGNHNSSYTNHHHHSPRGSSTPRSNGGAKSVENLTAVASSMIIMNTDSTSVRSSNSSLTKSEHSVTGGNGCDSPVSVLKTGVSTPRATSAHTKKVSISTEAPSRRDHVMVSPSGASSTQHGGSSNGTDRAIHRTSLIQVSSDRRAKKVRFFINNDKFFKGAVIAVSNEKFRTFDKLLEHLTRIMCTQVTLPNGVRYIFSLEGRQLQDIDTIQTGDSYVCSSTTGYKKLDYQALGRLLSHLIVPTVIKLKQLYMCLDICIM